MVTTKAMRTRPRARKNRTSPSLGARIVGCRDAAVGGFAIRVLRLSLSNVYSVRSHNHGGDCEVTRGAQVLQRLQGRREDRSRRRRAQKVADLRGEGQMRSWAASDVAQREPLPPRYGRSHKSTRAERDPPKSSATGAARSVARPQAAILFSSGNDSAAPHTSLAGC